MMFLLLSLLQQQGRLSRVVIIGAVLVFVAGVSLLVYFYRRYKRIEKESEEDWDASRHSLFVNVTPPAPKSEEAASAVVADIGATSVEEVATRGTHEFVSEIEPASPTPATPAEPRVEPAPPPQEPVRHLLPAEPPREPRATEVLASPPAEEPVTKTEAAQQAPGFEDQLWAGVEMGEPTIAHEHRAETAPLKSTEETPRVARVDERPHREPFESPSIDRIQHREPYEPPRIEPLTPREQAEATRALRSTPPPPPQIEEPLRDRPLERSAREIGLFGATSFRPSSSPSTAAKGETRELAAQPVGASAGRMPEPSVAGSYARKAPAGSVLGLPAETSHKPLILGERVRADSETGIGALSNYGKDLSERGGRAGTIALLIVVVLLGGAAGLYLFVPSMHARVNAFVAHMRGDDTQEAIRAAMKTKAQVIILQTQVNKSIVTARYAVDNISDEPLENLSVEVQLQRRGDAPPEIRTVSVTPNQLPPAQRGTFEFEYDGKRDSGFTGYKITRMFSNDAEVKFRTPPK